jgi:hypothetical protein
MGGDTRLVVPRRRAVSIRQRTGSTSDPGPPFISDVAPVLFNAAVVSRLNSLGVTGAPMDFNNLTMKTMVRYMKSHEGIRRVSEGLKAAGQPTP